MKGDFTSLNFQADNHYSSVRLQQGRVQLDADWNEQIDIAAHRDETTATDVMKTVNASLARDSGTRVGTEMICAPTTSFICQPNPLAGP